MSDTGSDIAAIRAAADTADQICPLVEQARDALSSAGGGLLDGHGLFADPSSLEGALRAARDSINKALALMSATDWRAARGAAERQE